MVGERTAVIMTWKGLPWVLGTLLLVAGGLAVFFLTMPTTAPVAHLSSDYSADMTAGPMSAQVIVLEYADFGCIGCRVVESFLGPLRKKYQDRVLFVYRFFPLETDRNTMLAAQVAYAASLQDSFWRMHDLLYQKQAEWAQSRNPDTLFDRYAAALGLNMDEFHLDMIADATIAAITKQRAEGLAAGVSNTPFLVVNGVEVRPHNSEDLEAAIRAGLQ